MRRPLKERDKHTPRPDDIYNSVKVSKLVNYVMQSGKKSVAVKAVHGAFEIIKKETGHAPVEVLEAALRNVGPTMEVRSRRVGGANYQVPYEVRPERRLSLALRWIIESTKTRKGVSIDKKLAQELVAASKGEGEAMKKRENVNRMAEANKAFAHFAFVGTKKKGEALGSRR